MHRSHRILAVVLILFCLGAAGDSGWQYGRIVEVRKSVNSRTRAWVANTPIYEDVPVYAISVHVQNKVVTGDYEPGSKGSPPPDEWTAQYPVEVQLQADTMYVRGPTARVKLHIRRRKSAGPMLPLTAEEKKNFVALDSPAQQESLIGFSKETKSAENPVTSPTQSDSLPPAPAPPSTGTVVVRSTPYLSEVFVDGESMGYTPAKIKLPPGKHTFRVEKAGYKPWTKELTLTIGSELTLDANLDRK